MIIRIQSKQVKKMHQRNRRNENSSTGVCYAYIASYDRIWRQCFAGKCTKRTQKAKIAQWASSNDSLVVHR
jgi:hypothetical protein